MFQYFFPSFCVIFSILGACEICHAGAVSLDEVREHASWLADDVGLGDAERENLLLAT